MAGNRLKSEADSYGRMARNSRYVNDRLEREREQIIELASNNEYYTTMDKRVDSITHGGRSIFRVLSGFHTKPRSVECITDVK